MKYIYAASLVLIMASCLGITAQGQTERQEPTSESVPDSLQLLTKQSLSNFPNFTRDIIEWPDNAKAKRSKLNRSNPLVAAGISNTVNWLAQVLQPNWIPSLGESSSVVAPLALKGDVQGNDAVRLRYKRHDSVIQVVSTSSGLNLLIQDTAPPKKDRLIGQAEAINYIAKKMDQYLQHSEEIKAVSLKLVREQGQGFRGDPNVRPETCNNWWGLVGWWTDGDVVLFSIGKAESGAFQPVLKANWLSSSP